MSLFLALQREPFIMVEATEEPARKLWQDILFYRELVRQKERPCLLPPPDGPALAGERANVVYELFDKKVASSIVTSKDALGANVWQPEVLKKDVLGLSTGAEIDRGVVRERLDRLGYSPVPLVTEKGQYSMRGWILDVFPSTSEHPFRAEFFGDEIESIRVFDIETQRSISGVSRFNVMPAREPDDGVNPAELINGVNWFCSESLQEVPEGAVVLSGFAIKGEGVDAGLKAISGLGVLPGERKSFQELAGALKGLGRDNKIVVVASSRGQAGRLKEIFRDGDLISPIVDIGDLLQYEGQVSITVGELSAGLFLPGFLILTEQEIFGGRPAFRAMKKSKVSRLIAAIDDLNEGDYIVHCDHGIGRFAGLMRQTVEGSEYELMTVEYAGGDRLYLPLYAIDKVQKYHSQEGVVPRLDSLGTRAWQKTKERVRKRIKDMAEKLLKIYAEREVSEGFAFGRDTEMHSEFDSFFLYEETPDQIRAVEEIKKDMESARPMDRLLCGDVGYGKTEVAMRAAFKAVYDGKQVAVLVPTTLLCEQHLRIFKKRFSAFPVTIDYLSRFKSRKERFETVRAVGRGQVDILIATHALFRADISFATLGLLIIDEEHRFGVRQKEMLKGLKKGVDVLAMSATPIPRTLQMALSGIRSMSVIETPPEERLSVKTIVSVFDEGLVREAIHKEIERGGQVFFVHNRIQDIMKIAGHVRRIVPDARVAVAHGRMPEKKLESIMMSFLNRDIDVFVSTAIIGSGLDIPTANTIIINMADRMGLADLYQLKGRVGRSNVRAFAYYLLPAGHIREDAKMRLQAIQELSYMGAGFRLAMKDLEIRGAGNLLGTEQSGYIHAVGFDMYVEMLEKAVAELKGMEVREKVRPTISIGLDAFIPEGYISDAALRLSVYRAVASSKSDKDIDGIKAEMTDRFGVLPEVFENLLRVMRLSLAAEELLITDIRRVNGRVRVTFAEGARMSADRILRIFKNRVKFLTDGFELSLKGNTFEEIRAALERL